MARAGNGGWMFGGITAFTVALGLAIMTGSLSSASATVPGANGKIAFHSDRDGQHEIYAMNADGSGQTDLSNNPASDVWPAWSPDGTRIAFQSYRDGNAEIYLMNADGSGQINITDNPANDELAAWSPDGTKIAFVRNGEIYDMNADGSAQTNLTNTAAGEGSPAWSPDGAKIAFSRDVGAGAGRLDIYTMNADGSGQTTLIASPLHDDNPNWSPDGSMIAFTSDRASLFSPDIYVANADGSGQTRLTTTGRDHYPAWSPDGAKVVFGSSRDGRGEVYMMNPDGSGQTRLTSGPPGTWNDRPDWQPLVHVDDVAPTTTITVEPPAGGFGWHLSDATVTLSAVDNDGGSGVAGTEYSLDNGNTWQSYTAPFGVGTEGTTTILARSTDNAGNIEAAKSVYVKIDENPPDIAIATPVDGVEYLLGQTVISDWTVSDPVSGVADAAATTPSGEALDTSAVGPRLFTAAARDNAGNESSATRVYYVRYAFVGFLRPIDADGESIFEAGRNVPVKFRLKDAAGRYVSGAAARIYLAKISDGVVGDEMEGVSAGKRTTGNLFRYDGGDNRYIFNLSTKGLSPGIWRIRVALDDGSSQSVTIRLRKHSRVEESESEYPCR